MKKNSTDKRSFVEFLNEYVSFNAQPNSTAYFDYKTNGTKRPIVHLTVAGKKEEITDFLPPEPYSVPKDYDNEPTRLHDERHGFETWDEFLGNNLGGAAYYLRGICQSQDMMLIVNGVV